MAQGDLARHHVRHDGGTLQHRSIIGWGLEARVFECFAEIIQLGKIEVAGRTAGSVLACERRDCVAPIGQAQQNCEKSRGYREGPHEARWIPSHEYVSCFE